ncbi:hypothetical protein [Geminicoccus flavidas]|uniref:hypothetical protein n=1 Tax=Geminicoccus flavidas TaxID=2506407 RepID=UPI00135BBB4D|nr:hypothetical protein [Geminicoccus flavidas]
MTADLLDAFAACAHLRVKVGPNSGWLVDMVEEALAAHVAAAPPPARRRRGVSRAKAARNDHIRHAAAMLPADLRLRPRAEALAKIVQTYISRCWPADQASIECPERIAETIEEHIWRALVVDSIRFPKGWRHLMEIIQ